MLLVWRCWNPTLSCLLWDLECQHNLLDKWRWTNSKKVKSLNEMTRSCSLLKWYNSQFLYLRQHAHHSINVSIMIYMYIYILWYILIIIHNINIIHLSGKLNFLITTQVSWRKPTNEEIKIVLLTIAMVTLYLNFTSLKDRKV